MDRTNVVKLFATLEKDPDRQASYYHPGVGTLAPPGFVTKAGSRTAELLGLAFAYGLDRDIRDAYTYIANYFEPGDRLFLFGFSRGAYTVRVVAAMLRMYGLIPKGNEPLVPYAIRLMWKIHTIQARRTRDRNDPRRPDDVAVAAQLKADANNEPPHPQLEAYFALANQFKATYSSECKPHFVGVWDTVSSVGWFANPVSLPFTTNNPDIAIGRHAVAIDERRAFFRTNLWKADPGSLEVGPRDIKQVWFPGAHADVGGGYPESESGLSKIALSWMLDEAKAAGLLVNETKEALILGKVSGPFAPPDPNATLHDSLTAGWRFAEYVPKPHWNAAKQEIEWRANRFKPRTWPSQPVVHDSAWLRNDAYANRLPPDAIRLSQWSPVVASNDPV